MRISDWSSDVCSSDLWIYVERDALAIGVNRRTDVPLIGDLCDVLPQLQKELEGTTRPRPPQIDGWVKQHAERSEEHPSEIQSHMRNSYAAFWLKKKN